MAVIVLTAGLPATPGERQAVVTVAQRDLWRGDQDAPSAVVSADGRFIAFTSSLDLVPADSNGRRDVYVLDCADGRITLESLSPAGQLSDVDSDQPAISADGETLVYETSIAADGSASPVIVLRDRRRSTTEVIAMPARQGPSAPGWSGFPAISGDGHVIAFASRPSTIGGGSDDGGGSHVYVLDRRDGTFRQVSLDTDVTGPPRHVAPSLSADGRYVAFTSAIPDPGGARRSMSDVYVRDTRLQTTRRLTGSTTRVADGPSWDPAISADGRFVAFVSEASTLAPNDRNRSQDVFVHDLHTRSTELVSRSPRGGSGNGRSGNPAISADGRFVVFQSEASDLVCAGGCASGHEDINLLWDVFLFDRETGVMRQLSGDGREGWMEASSGPAVDGSGGVVTFSSRHPIDASDTRNDFDLFIWTAPRASGAGDAQERCALRASARTASTIDISPMPLAGHYLLQTLGARRPGPELRRRHQFRRQIN